MTAEEENEVKDIIKHIEELVKGRSYNCPYANNSNSKLREEFHLQLKSLYDSVKELEETKSQNGVG